MITSIVNTGITDPLISEAAGSVPDDRYSKTFKAYGKTLRPNRANSSFWGRILYCKLKRERKFHFFTGKFPRLTYPGNYNDHNNEQLVRAKQRGSSELWRSDIWCRSLESYDIVHHEVSPVVAANAASLSSIQSKSAISQAHMKCPPLPLQLST